MSEPWEFQPRVDKGCKLLDERLGPEWVEKIDLDQLNLQSNCDCILGQTSFGVGGKPYSYQSAAEILFPPIIPLDSLDHDSIEAHGFVLYENLPWDYLALTECWRQTILSRRQELS